MHSLQPLFRPRSVAVVGASRKRGTIGYELFRNLIVNGFTGAVYPVNPQSRVIQSVRAYPTVSSIPDEVDLAVIAVPGRFVEDVVDDCVSAKVKSLVILSAGFGEVGEAGKAAQERIVAKVRAAGMRMVGPNCLGVVNTDPEVQMDATFAPTWPPAGSVGFSSQSGALGVAILDYAQELGIGLSQFVSVGNKADVSGNDLLEWWEQDQATRVILLYLESFGNPRRFMNIARRVGRTKPIVVVKSGRTDAGARAASSHTGALATRELAVKALLSQSGVIRTNTIEELFDMAILLANQPIPAGNRVAIVTNGGGPGIMASDACASRGLVLPSLSDETVAELRKFLPPEASFRNPVDMIASANEESYERALRAVLADDQIDAVLVLFVPPIMTEATDVAAGILRAAAGCSKPVLTCFMGTHGIPPALSSLHEGKIPSYAFPEAAALALSRAVQYRRWLNRPEGTIPVLPGTDAARGRAAIVRSQRAGGDGEPKGGWLDPEAVADLLDAYGIPTLKSRFAADADAAAKAAASLGFPVALKLSSPTITHKSEMGGVHLGLGSKEEVRSAFAVVEQRMMTEGRRSEMDGVVVQQMARRGVETMVGMTRDPLFGPEIAFGIGGVNVELWADLVFRICPITDGDAAEMMDEIRAARLLDGFRGSPAADRGAIADVLLRISRMAMDLPEIEELDINPLVALEPGQGVVAVDARIRVSPVTMPAAFADFATFVPS